MRRVALALGLVLPSVDLVSDAFVFRTPALRTATSTSCREHAAVVAAGAPSRRAAHTGGSCRKQWQAAAIVHQQHRGQTARRRTIEPAYSSFEPEVGAATAGAGGDGGDPEPGFDGDMAPVDLDQAMGSFSPEWANDTARVEAKEQLIKGSIIAADQTVFPYPIDNFPPLANSEVYYNGTSERYWWNQDSDAVNVYVPVPEGFEPEKVDFVAKTRQVSLKFDGEEVLSGTPFYRIDGYESLYVFDADNDPPYVQLELYKVREYQNWEDLLLETSSFTPGGAQ